jgi:hypothetical protein
VARLQVARRLSRRSTSHWRPWSVPRSRGASLSNAFPDYFSESLTLIKVPTLSESCLKLF